MCPPGGAKKQTNLTTFSFRFAFIWAKKFSLVSRASRVDKQHFDLPALRGEYDRFFVVY